MCFYEPLSEDLAMLSPAAIEACGAASWSSGHPALHDPYFAEFRPLLKTLAHGVREHEAAFAVSGFFADADTAMPELRDYIALLLDRACGQGDQPVLKFCRSIGRVGWMQRNFPQAIHIALLRNPLAQFVSAQRQFQRHGNPYFLAMPLLLLGLHRDQADIAAALRHFAVALPPLPARISIRDGLAACAAYLQCIEPAVWYRAFLAFWMLAAASIPETIDLVIDSDLLSTTGEYRRQCAIDVATLTGRAISFADVHGAPGADASLLAGSGLSRGGLWQAHVAAEAFLADRAGDAWADSPLLARVGAMLNYATLLAASPLHAGGLASAVRWDTVCAESAALAADAQRAVSAEARLAAVYGSRFWKVTAPLRWVCERLPALPRLV